MEANIIFVKLIISTSNGNTFESQLHLLKNMAFILWETVMESSNRSETFSLVSQRWDFLVLEFGIHNHSVGKGAGGTEATVDCSELSKTREREARMSCIQRLISKISAAAAVLNDIFTGKEKLKSFSVNWNSAKFILHFVNTLHMAFTE